MSKWMESELFGDFLGYPESLLVVQTVFELSWLSLECPESF